MITFDQYVFYSYVAGVLAAAALLIRAAYVWIDISDQKILRKYRLPFVSLSNAEYEHYVNLQEQLDDMLEILCKVPVTVALPKRMSANLIDTGEFDFVVCEKRTGKIRFISEISENCTAEKGALCKIAGLRYAISETTTTQESTYPSTREENNSKKAEIGISAKFEDNIFDIDLNLSANRKTSLGNNYRSTPLNFGSSRTLTDDRTGLVQKI